MIIFKPNSSKIKILANLEILLLVLFLKRLNFVPCNSQHIQNKITFVNSYNRFTPAYLRGEFDL